MRFGEAETAEHGGASVALVPFSKCVELVGCWRGGWLVIAECVFVEGLCLLGCEVDAEGDGESIRMRDAFVLLERIWSGDAVAIEEDECVGARRCFGGEECAECVVADLAGASGTGEGACGVEDGRVELACGVRDDVIDGGVVFVAGDGDGVSWACLVGDAKKCAPEALWGVGGDEDVEWHLRRVWGGVYGRFAWKTHLKRAWDRLLAENLSKRLGFWFGISDKCRLWKDIPGTI